MENDHVTTPASETPAGVPWELLTLPAFPSVSAKALQLLSSSDTRLFELYQVVSSDPSFASEVLRIANSPLYPLQSAVRNLTQAAMMLGFERLKNVAVTIGIRSYLGEVLAVPALRACWRHSLACALIAEEATSTNPTAHGYDAYTAGMLHDLGRLALAAIRPQPYAKLLESGDEGGDMLERERRMFGIDHCEAGRCLVSAWRLPSELADFASQHHENMKERKFDHVSLIHYSCRFADVLGFYSARPLHPPTYDELLQEVPASERRRFSFDPQTMALAITSRIDGFDAT
jgi:HD-like signal output (HDOD) protein